MSALAICVVVGAVAMAVAGVDQGTNPAQGYRCTDQLRFIEVTARPPLDPATPHPINAGSLSEITNAVHVLGESKYGEFYAGVAMDTDTDRVSLWRKPSAEFDQEVAVLPGHQRIDIYCARHSLRELLVVAERLLDDGEYWRAQGMELFQFGPRVEGDCVEVGVADPQRVAEQFRILYPDMPVCVVKSVGGFGPG